MLDKIERILGKFPIFGKTIKRNKAKNLEGEFTLSNDPYAVYKTGISAFEDGFDTDKPVDVNQLNSVLRMLSTGISYLYEQGVPEYTLNFAYPKGAVVAFDGSLYVSLADSNTTHVKQSNHWDRLVTSKELCESSVQDTNPIGTIVTVPTGTELSGYIEYKAGESFSELIYPELAKVLKTNTFGSTSGNKASTDVPVGSLMYSLSKEVPEGWIEFKAYVPMLFNYPKLKRMLELMVQDMPLSTMRRSWEKALSQDMLPDLEGNDFFLRSTNTFGELGKYSSDITKVNTFGLTPMVIDSSNTLNPLGVSRESTTETQIAVSGASYFSTGTESPYVLVGQRTDSYTDLSDTTFIGIDLGTEQAMETAPKALSAKLLIKAVDITERSIPTTHTQLIKAFNQ